jgi:hypothetical protein
MKRTIFIILWMVAFWIAAVIVWSVGVALFAPVPWSDETTRKVMFWDRVGFYGFPILALILGIFRKLPGTRSKKPLVHEPVA